MKRKIISAMLAVIIAAGMSACEKKTDEKATESDAQAASSTVTEAVTQASTTAPVTTTVPATTQPATTKKQTTAAKPTTTKKKVITTTKKVVTTIKEALTTRETTEKITEKRTRVNSLIKRRTEEETVNTELRYGVVSRQIITTYYEEQEDGTEIVVKKEVSTDVIDRTFYAASYSDLLPAAKKNRETYRSQINEILRIINGYRAEGGLDPLRLNEDLVIVSCARAEEIAWSGNHTHTRPNLSSWATIMRDNGFPKGLAGENIGWGFADAKSVCEAWKASETHYENIMNPDFTEIGIGVAPDADPQKKLCWAQHFYEG